jgi:hypothetical protein
MKFSKAGVLVDRASEKVAVRNGWMVRSVYGF